MMTTEILMIFAVITIVFGRNCMKTYTVWLPIAESGLRLANAGELETIIFIFIFLFWLGFYFYIFSCWLRKGFNFICKWDGWLQTCDNLIFRKRINDMRLCVVWLDTEANWCCFSHHLIIIFDDNERERGEKQVPNWNEVSEAFEMYMLTSIKRAKIRESDLYCVRTPYSEKKAMT